MKTCLLPQKQNECFPNLFIGAFPSTPAENPDMSRLRFVGLAGIAFASVGSLAAIIGASRADEAQTPPNLQPIARKHHSVAYHRGLQKVVMYGGASNANQFLDDFWSYDGQRWTLVGRSIPSSTHHMFSDADGTLFMVGGLAGMTATWDGSAWVQMFRGPERWAIGGAYDAPRRRFVLHGGGGAQGVGYGDTLEFDGTSWQQVATDGPPARILAGMVFDTARNIAVLFGGANVPADNGPSTVYDDFWEWNGVRWHQLEQSGDRPPARVGFAMTYDQVRREVVLFGGLDSNFQPLGDTWLWNGGHWRRHEGDGPSARDLTEMAFDTARGVTVLFGGDSNTSQGSLADTWEWDGSRWTRRDTP
jgi:hypothetical protein